MENEKLRELQYPPDNSFANKLASIAQAYEKRPQSNWRWRVVVIDGATVGDIFYFGWKRKIYSWNLDPYYWGNGIMPKALELLFSEQFALTANLVIRADCFPNNNQSRRLMEKLGFQQIVCSRFWQWLWDVFSAHSRKVIRFRLRETDFENRSMQSYTKK